jgi:hypothetical protein
MPADRRPGAVSMTALVTARARCAAGLTAAAGRRQRCGRPGPTAGGGTCAVAWFAVGHLLVGCGRWCD